MSAQSGWVTSHWHSYEPEGEIEMSNLTGSAYVRAVVELLIAHGAPLDLSEADLDEEQCNIPTTDGGWLHWTEDDGWFLRDDRGFPEAPLCAPYTPIEDAARIVFDYV